ncbi:ABC transporter permease [Pseudonocardia yunnanensis]|uniref:ABC transporter permease n=1 Tax=Pseudonocardia yunnanensis TaxID=58107 RepID=A0ABW4EL92_9PSEU
MTSAYPLAHDVLVARVRQMIADLGRVPSQRQVMQVCAVGRDRAKTALAEATAPAPQVTPVVDAPDSTLPIGAENEQGAPAERTLHAVPDLEADPAPGHTDGAEIAPETRADAPAAPSTPEPVAPVAPKRVRVPRWPISIIALGAFVSIWGGWVGLGRMTGFGKVQLLPGIADSFVIDSAITLPLGVEAYAAYALWVWLAPPTAQITTRARRFACWSAIAGLALGVFGQATYHLLVTTGATTAPWPVVTFVSCLPVLVLGAGAALAHLAHQHDEETDR